MRIIEYKTTILTVLLLKLGAASAFSMEKQSLTDILTPLKDSISTESVKNAQITKDMALKLLNILEFRKSTEAEEDIYRHCRLLKIIQLFGNGEEAIHKKEFETESILPVSKIRDILKGYELDRPSETYTTSELILLCYKHQIPIIKIEAGKSPTKKVDYVPMKLEDRGITEIAANLAYEEALRLFIKGYEKKYDIKESILE